MEESYPKDNIQFHLHEDLEKAKLIHNKCDHNHNDCLLDRKEDRGGDSHCIDLDIEEEEEAEALRECLLSSVKPEILRNLDFSINQKIFNYSMHPVLSQSRNISKKN